MSLEYSTISVFFFFFQAEDGIRDIGVTGVQTCALPIWFCEILLGSMTRRQWCEPFRVTPTDLDGTWTYGDGADTGAGPTVSRSEERRVGKECRSRWSPYH